ncbi:MFS transporter [Haloactinomyces albus]|uniref:MFS family permease n=1 Tax=Haloactinomyces albus TaxID=1352928 RepID=A0AAE3ZHV2_9ACTN|nr:MFS transporter [Haloactinomyces albus]MDR7304350.1 MFS family permease [Haloactinomyces albus]
MTTVQAPPASSPNQRRKEVRRVVLSSYLGSTIEFYDFILYATAASLVFGPVFFANLSPALGIITSYATFAVAYLSRPLGGIIFGHFGDVLGRKKMLILSMSIMGGASTLIGLIPPIETWGAVMLIVLRVCQGIAVGGEWGGAALMSLEHVKGAHRGFAASFTNAGAPTGAALGTVALAIAGLLPEEQFLAWGWRIPFLLSAVMLGIGLFVRARVSESPLFREAVQQQEKQEKARKKERIPLVSVLKRPKNLILCGLVCMAGFAMQALFSTFAINHAAEHGVARSQALAAFAICQFAAIFFILLFAWISDRIGRRPVMLAGLVTMIVVTYPVFAMLESGSFPLVIAAFLISLSLCQSATFGPLPAFVSEQFGTRARYTGASLGYQLASLLGAGFTPVIVATLAASAGGSVSGVMLYLVAICLASAAILLLFVTESKDNDLQAVPQH